VPHGHWRTTTFIAGLKQTGIIAPLVLDGPITGVAFLAPALAPGAVVVLDNLAAHKVDGVRQAIAAAGGAILYLPPYSPDLNPPPCPQANAPTISATAAMVQPKTKRV
jgi:DDE superfamily endonuclease